MTDIQGRLAAAFEAEHREHLEAVRAMLGEAARQGFDTRTFDFTEAHRRVHSLKGAARAVGLPAIEKLSHHLETLVERCRKGDPKLDEAVSGIIHRAFDDIEDWAATLRNPTAPHPAGTALIELERLLETGGAAADTAGNDRPQVAPAATAGKADAATPSTRSAATADRTVRVNVDILDAVLRQSSEIVTESGLQDRIAADLRRLRNDIDSWSGSNRHAGPVAGDALHDILARLKDISGAQREAAWRLRKLGAQLHHDVRELRIVPAESLFGNFRKMVRDLARDDGKDVEVVVSGLETQADRKVLQALRDPVLHLLRNAISHGIESPQVRTRQGKPATGRISLHVTSLRGRLVVRVDDDGAGLNRQQITAEAARRGLLSAGSAPDNPETLAAVLVQPGFSTAARLTEISGRGMGLSIVDKTVRRLRGTFDISGSATGGTTATISAPLTVAAERVLAVRCSEQTYCIPVHAIESVRRLAPDDVTTIGGAPFIAVTDDDDSLPLAVLSQILGLRGAAPSREERPVQVVILHIDGTRLGIAVDELESVQYAVVHDLEATAPGLTYADGAIVRGDGSAAILLNPRELIKGARDLAHGDAFEPQQGAERDVIPEILIVDDSITTRTLEKSILEATGYRVRLSTDGVDALEQLRQKPVDLIIADVEMPRMDGFELLHAVRGDAALKDLPFILVTSRDAPEDRRRGLTLGAQAYILKQRFDQRDLLAAIEQIL